MIRVALFITVLMTLLMIISVAAVYGLIFYVIYQQVLAEHVGTSLSFLDWTCIVAFCIIARDLLLGQSLATGVLSVWAGKDLSVNSK